MCTYDFFFKKSVILYPILLHYTLGNMALTNFLYQIFLLVAFSYKTKKNIHNNSANISTSSLLIKTKKKSGQISLIFSHMNQSKYQANNCSIHHITDSPPYQHIIYIFIATRVLLNSSKFEQYY